MKEIKRKECTKERKRRGIFKGMMEYI